MQTASGAKPAASKAKPTASEAARLLPSVGALEEELIGGAGHIAGFRV